jgi:agmatine deiminase
MMKMTRRGVMLAAGGGLTSLPARVAGPEKSVKPLSYRQPDEASPHHRTLMQWPASADIYGSSDDLAAVREKIALIANTIARFEPVTLLVRSDQEAQARRSLRDNVETLSMPVDDLWARDSGPTFVVNAVGELAVCDLNFNGWGDKQEHGYDSAIAAHMAEHLGLQRILAGVVGEAGGVENDGDGTLLAHASSWVNRNRNGDASAGSIAKALCEALGAEKMIWAPGLIDQDITDYHIDALARFVAPGRVLIQLPAKRDSSDPWANAAYQTYDVLKSARDAKGRKLEVIVLPEPENIRVQDEDFVASYVNYYVCNGAVISAEFGSEKADAEAAELLKRLYPGREVVSLDIDAIGQSGGGIHCATQQMPKGV